MRKPKWAHFFSTASNSIRISKNFPDERVYRIGGDEFVVTSKTAEAELKMQRDWRADF